MGKRKKIKKTDILTYIILILFMLYVLFPLFV